MSKPVVAHHFDSLDRQWHAGRTGMWLFLASEVLLFAGLFLVYGYYRVAYPAGFAAAAHHNNVLIGTVNTVVLLTSSLFVALATHTARQQQRNATAGLLAASVALGLLFLVFKGMEWSQHIHEGILPGRHYTFQGVSELGANMFFTIYYCATGLHALHVIIGMSVLAVLTVQSYRDVEKSAFRVELGGLYWHLVDVIWIFLYPLFYLVG